jgi:hypothetical protein
VHRDIVHAGNDEFRGYKAVAGENHRRKSCVLVDLVAPEAKIDDLDDTVFSNPKIVLTERQTRNREEITVDE